MKKIVIMGPVNTASYFGGVATFDEELMKGFKKIGCEVYIFTKQCDVQKEKGIYIIKNFLHVKRLIEAIKPDIIIASLEYGKYFFFLEKKYVTIYFLHGFFNRRNYGYWKSNIASLFQKIVSLKADYVVSNSFFTRMINEEFFNIKSDKVIHLGNSEDYIKQTFYNRENIKEEGSILFSGRLVKAKYVDKLLEAIKLLSQADKKYKLYVAGDGDCKDELEKYTKDNGLNIVFCGKLSHVELYKYYQKCEVFVSLNPSEPFGIVFLEAILNNCKIVCPLTGGQIEIIYNLNKENFCCVDHNSAKSIADGIEGLFDKTFIRNTNFHERYNYEFVARQFINFVNEK